MLNTEDRSFDEFYLSDEMRRALKSVGYHRPTRVQAASLPLILAGIDLTLESQTGSGKTAAFAIPVIEMLEPRPGRIDVLVLTPTRELAQQVCDEFERLGQFKELRAIAIYGGTSYERQYDALKKASIVVATPGRLLDLCERGKIDLRTLRILVLDEADEMLSMGFRDDIEAVMTYLPEERQSILCSATITEEIKALANKILFYPEFITFSSDSVASADVSHYYYNVRGVGRLRDLLKALEYEEPESAIIFANTKADTFTVTSFLKRHGYRADVLNGDLPQQEREKTLHALRAGEIDFIVATDVAARGIDISDLSHVINYMLPDSAEVYIHRTGRTGRAGKKGSAISLIAPTEVGTFFQIRKTYKVKLKERSLPTTREIMIARQRRLLEKLDRQVGELENLPYGAYLRIADDLLTADQLNGDSIERTRLVARLLALAEQVIEGEFVRPTNGRGPVAEKVAPVRQEESAPAVEVEEMPASKPVVPEVKEAASTPAREAAVEEAPRGRRRRRGSGRPVQSKASAQEAESTQPEPKAVTAPQEIEEIIAASEPVELESARKMYVNLGRNVFESARELVDMLCYMSGMDPEDFGSVVMENAYSFVQVRDDYFRDVILALNGQDWEGNSITAEAARK